MKLKELQERQSWSLEQKIDHSIGVIDQFYRIKKGQVYIGFSGGKDSTVLLWIARKIYPDIKAVFCNTRNEYPDIVKFVRNKKNNGENIEIIYPELTPGEVINMFGFPLISKSTSGIIGKCKRNPNGLTHLNYVVNRNSQFALPKKYMYLLDEPYMVDSKCCEYLKKKPFHKYQKETGLFPITGEMASESVMRTNTYLKIGQCNVYSGRRPVSRPLSIWLEQDIWDCIKKYKIEIADIYNKGANRTGCMFCGYGCQFKDDNRLQLMYKNHPKFYQTCMKYSNNGVTYREALKKFLAVNNLSLPDEK